MTEQTETVDTQHTDLLSMVNDIDHNKDLCEGIEPIKFELGMKIWLAVKQFKPHNMKELQQKYIAPYYISSNRGESTC